MTADDTSPTLASKRTNEADMSDDELDRTSREADPDDLGGTGLDSGLTAGGTDTSLEQAGTSQSGGGIRGHGGGGTVGGTSSGTIGGGMEPGEDQEEPLES